MRLCHGEGREFADSEFEFDHRYGWVHRGTGHAADGSVISTRGDDRLDRLPGRAPADED